MTSRTFRAVAGFSLIEVSAAISIVSVALVSLLALVPIGVTNSRSTVNDTRGAELARTVLATISGEPFTKARCFSESEAPLDLSTLDQSQDGAEPTLLYASYSAQRDFALIVRASSLPKDMTGDLELYRIELRNQPQRFPGLTGTTPAGSVLRVSIFSGRERTPFFSTTTYLGSFGKAGVLPAIAK